MNAIFKYIRKNWFELLITFFIFTNLFPYWFPQWTYYVSFILILYKMIQYGPLGKLNITFMFLWFAVLLLISTSIGMALDLRLVIFFFILFLCAPRKSLKWHNYKKKLLYNIYVGFGIATLANFYARLNGINIRQHDEYMTAMGRVAEFSGFCSHPMWTACAAALSSIFFTNMAFRRDGTGKIRRVIFFSLVLVSLYITMISGSRSAFFIALACIIFTVILLSQKISTLLKYIMILGITSVFFAPILIDNSQAMMQKKNALEITLEETSREELWSQRIAEFNSSPLIGIGFAAHGVGYDKMVGRNESGGSYISVLAQAGIIGMIFIILIWASAIMLPKKVGRNPDNILIYVSFIFFSIHSIVEGYMFQAGWYLCLIVWMIVGVMIEHKQKNRLV